MSNMLYEVNLKKENGHRFMIQGGKHEEIYHSNCINWINIRLYHYV